MQAALNQSTGGEAASADVARFRKWALVVGCLYGSVTLFVAILATLGVLAGRPTISSGYSSGSSLTSERLNGDFWPLGSQIDMLPPLQSIAG